MIVDDPSNLNTTTPLTDPIKVLLNSYTQPVLAMDTAGNVIDCNQHFLSVYDLSVDDLLLKNYFAYFKELGVALPGDSIQSLMDDDSNKITFHRIDEKRFLKYLQWTLFKIELAPGNAVFILLAHDVTPILEVATKEQLLLDSLIDSVPAEIFWKDKSLVYLGCNKSFVNSLDLEDKSEVIGKTDFDLPVDRKDSHFYRDDDLQIIRSKVGKLDIVERQFVNGVRERVLSTSKVPLFDDQGEVYGILGVCRDITEHKKSEDKLKQAIAMAEQANYTKSEFIANMSHDIRTPLSGVVGISQLLVDTLSDSEHQQQAQWIHECGVQLLSLLNDILTVIASDDDSAKYAEKEEVFCLRQCLDDLVHLERPSTEMKGISLDVNIDPDTPEFLFGDRSSLYRILLNLLGNAIKFTTVGGVRVDVKVLEMSEAKVCLHFVVSDTGIGIPEDLQNKVFDRFYRANPSYKGVYSGHGIGLHIANSYVTRMGGGLQFASAVGDGTSFYFDLGFNIAEGQKVDVLDKHLAHVAEGDTPISANSSDSPIVLLIEDNYVALKVLESTAKLVNIRFVSANDGESALEIATRQNFNLIITDIGLPGISGKELARKLRAWENMQDRLPVPIIGLTAHVRDQVREKCIDAGMNDAYSKPIDLQTMNEIIKRFVF